MNPSSKLYELGASQEQKSNIGCEQIVEKETDIVLSQAQESNKV